MNTNSNSPAQPATVHELDGAASLAKSILIVENDTEFAESLRSFLEGLGYHVDSALDGVFGIRKIMSKDYGIILCDMVMPNLAGDMFYKGVERVKPHLCRRFVFMTGYSDDKKIDEFIRNVRGLALWKPFKLNVLVEAIQAVEIRVKQDA